MNTLSLFSGYAGIDLALSSYCKPILYCEKDEYAQGILLSRMDEGSIPFAPIWNDVATLDGKKLRGLVDIIVGGFPCQDISVAGRGAGLEGERSGLFYEICRIARESEAPFIFLENVPAIETRGAEQVQEALASMGYASRWLHLSAAEVGANHKRERWFCLAYSMRKGLERHGLLSSPLKEKTETLGFFTNEGFALDASWWETEPNMGRVADGITFRMDRIKALGNGVVPLQVKTAFEILLGIKNRK